MHLSDWGVMYSILSFHRSQNCCVWLTTMFARASYYLEPQLFALACRPRRFHYHWYTGRPPKTQRQRRHPHTHHVHVSGLIFFLRIGMLQQLATLNLILGGLCVCVTTHVGWSYVQLLHPLLGEHATSEEPAWIIPPRGTEWRNVTQRTDAEESWCYLWYH